MSNKNIKKDEIIVPDGLALSASHHIINPEGTTLSSLILEKRSLAKQQNGSASPNDPSEPNENNNDKNDKFDDKYEENPSEPNPLDGVGSLSALAEQVLNPPGLAEELFNIDKDIEAKTRLTPELVAQIAIARQMALAYNVPMLEDFAVNIMKLRISILGEGRKEGVDMVKGQNLVGFTNDFAQRTKG
jgi:hypothetical protein